MYNSFKTFAEIKQDIYSQDLIKNHDCYLAHTHPDKKSEKFNAHNNLVIDYCIELIQAHSIDNVIDRIISSISPTTSNDTLRFGNFVKQLFISTLIYHDYGKVNDNFQIRIMKNLNTVFKPKQLKIETQHSILSAYIFIVYHLSVIEDTQWSREEKQLLLGLIFVFSYSIIKHHSPFLLDGKKDIKIEEDIQKEMVPFLSVFNFSNVESSCFKPAYKNKKGEKYKNLRIDAILSLNKSFELFSLVKLNFSLLTAADYLATHEYMNTYGEEGKTTDFGIFSSSERKEEMLQYLKSHKQHNKESYHNIDNYIFTHPQEKSNANLNQLRQEMAVELIQTIRKNTTKQLFYIEAPTGAGKTNLSILTVAELLSANPELNKVFYVFPFTTLITQTYSVLKETLDLKEHEIVELHSKAGFNSKKGEEKEDDLYGDEKKDYIDNLFALYPVTLLSHVKFFDILKTSKKESNYLLHRIANSIVVIDEIQSYNPLIWDKMLYFINQYSAFFNIKFILMSATLPKISSLNIGLTQKLDFVELLPNARKYITNKNFSERVIFNFELFDNEISLDSLAETVIEKSNNYISKHGSVRTIIEFIYKKSASDFQQVISNSTNFFDKIFVLSGTVLESQRREIINFIKRTAKSKINILLITTQVVEAGVDIDMDLGFKNVSLIDSDEQLAGRVNRNAFKEDCEVYLFKLDDAKILYGKDYRYKQTREKITQEQYQQILKEKDFKILYEKVIDVIDEVNERPFKDNFPNYEADLNQLQFKEVDKNFKIIDQDNESVFVPLKVPVTIQGSEDEQIDEIFTLKDLAFLNQFKVVPIDGFIDGKEVWEVYETLIDIEIQKRKSKVSFDIKGKIDFKILQSIMSKFSFSLMYHSKDFGKIRDGFGEEKFGYLYFSHWDEQRTEGKAYSYKYGLNSKAFSDSYFI